jgi:DNA-directed RNA polymerase specialized sigma24 family protein
MTSVERAPAGVSRVEQIERLYRERGDRIWRGVLAFSGDPEVASDAVADAFRAGAAPRRGGPRPGTLDLAGGLPDRGGRAEGAEEERRARGGWVVRDGGTGQDLVVALRSLSERQRASVVLHDAAGYPAREVARIVGSTEAAVRVHLMRGRRRLTELLKDDDHA